MCALQVALPIMVYCMEVQMMGPSDQRVAVLGDDMVQWQLVPNIYLSFTVILKILLRTIVFCTHACVCVLDHR